MHYNLIKRILIENSKMINISIRISELEYIFKQIIKEDTDVEVADRLSLDYDEMSFSIVTILEEKDFSEKEIEALGHYDFREWYKTTNYVLESLFGEYSQNISLYTSEEEIERNEDNDYLVFMNMPLKVYEKMKEVI